MSAPGKAMTLEDLRLKVRSLRAQARSFDPVMRQALQLEISALQKKLADLSARLKDIESMRYFKDPGVQVLLQQSIESRAKEIWSDWGQSSKPPG